MDILEKPFPSIPSLIGGSLSVTNRCLECDHTRTMSDKISTLPVPFPPSCPSPVSLVDLLRSYTSPERLMGVHNASNLVEWSRFQENKLLCESEKCGNTKRGGIRQVELEALPPFLLFSLSRFHYHPKEQSYSKVFTPVRDDSMKLSRSLAQKVTFDETLAVELKSREGVLHEFFLPLRLGSYSLCSCHVSFDSHRRALWELAALGSLLLLRPRGRFGRRCALPVQTPLY